MHSRVLSDNKRSIFHLLCLFGRRPLLTFVSIILSRRQLEIQCALEMTVMTQHLVRSATKPLQVQSNRRFVNVHIDDTA